MKILYACGEYSSPYQITNYLNYNKNEIKIAAFPFSGKSLNNYTWNLSAAKTNKAILIEDIRKYNPDIAVIDDVKFIANICDQLNIPFLTCSSLNLFLENEKEYKKSLVNLIYSPFGDFFDFSLKENYEFISPYINMVENIINDNICLCLIDKNKKIDLKYFFDDVIYDYYNSKTYLLNLSKVSTVLTYGDISIISDAIYNQKQLLIIPRANNLNDTLNAENCQKFNLGINFGQIDLLNKTKILLRFEKELSKFNFIPIVEKKYNNKKLHERIED